MPNSGKKPREQRRFRRKQQILTSARTLFASQGFEETTMQQVVQEAGTSIGNCYFYFPNKEALLHAIIEEISMDILSRMEESIDEFPPGAAQLAISFYVFIEVLLENSEITRLVFRREAHIKLRSAFLQFFGDIFQRFLKEHPELLISSDLPLALITTAWEGGCIALLERTFEEGDMYDMNTLARFLVRWNLQAMGLPVQQITDALDTLNQYVQQKNSR